MRHHLLLLLLLSTLALHASAKEINVPADYLQIQEAIKNSVDGDTILVAPGTYYEKIHFGGRRVTVRSTQGPAVTVIDAGLAGRAITFNSGENHTTVFEGFTVTHGYNAGNDGGGIYCASASPRIRYNIITGNVAERGGGVFLNGASPELLNNVIASNTADFGAGIFGIFQSDPLIASNLVYGNFSNVNGGGIQIGYDSHPEILNNLIFSNRALEAGGGLLLGLISNPLVANNTFYGNVADVRGGGICLWAEASPTLVNSILWDNQSPLGPEIYVGYIVGGYPPCDGTIRYCDVKGGLSSIFIDLGQALDWGVGNIDQDPLFVDPAQNDFRLAQDPVQPGVINPCVDVGSRPAGNAGMGLLSTRTDEVWDQGGVDMGFHQGTYLEQALFTDRDDLSESLGGSVNLTLKAGVQRAGRPYLVFGGVTGSWPGTTLPGGAALLPMNWDPVTNFIALYANTPLFKDFLGQLDGQGQGAARLNLAPFTGAVGYAFTFAFALGNPWDFASNPVSVEIVP